ncbi:MAG: AbfB domain-containing protein, partial [Thermoanaerobaculia bacterium]
MAHKNFLGVIIELTEPDKENTTFQIVQGLAAIGNPRAISFESLNYPGYYFQHSNFRLHLQTSDGTPGFKENATYWIEPGNTNPTQAGLIS